MGRSASRQRTHGGSRGNAGRTDGRRPGRSAPPAAEAGFSLLEVVLALFLLTMAIGSTAELLTSAIKVGSNSRLKEVATDIASSVLDCALAQGGGALLTQASQWTRPTCAGSSGQVTEGGTTFTVVQQASPDVGSSCAAPQNGVANELSVTDVVTWAHVSGSWWNDTRWATERVSETSYVAVPGSAINASDGEILAIVSDGNASAGEGGATVTAALGAPPGSTNPAPTDVRTAVSSSDGCVLFANITPGNWYLTATGLSGWLGTAEVGTAYATTYPQAVTAGAPTSVFIKYAPAGTVTPAYTTTAGAVPTNIADLPLTFSNSNLTSAPDPWEPPWSATDSYPVFPTTYTVVAGQCGTDSAPDGAATDGQSVPVPDGGAATATFPLTPLKVAVVGGTAGMDAVITAQPGTSASPDANCTTSGQVLLQLGSTPVSTASAVTLAPGRLPPSAAVLMAFLHGARRQGAPPAAGPKPVPMALDRAVPMALDRAVPTALDSAVRLGLSAPDPQLMYYGSGGLTMYPQQVKAVYGQSVTLQASVSGWAFGTVTFTGDGVTLCQASMVWGSAQCSATPPAGSYTVTATFGSSHTTALATITQDPTTVTVSSSANPSLSGAAVTLTATVAPSGSPSATPTGTVTFFANGAPIGSPVPLASGQATAALTTTALANGEVITARYSGDQNFAGSVSAGFTQQVVTVTSTDDTALPFGTWYLAADAGSGAYTGSTVIRVVDVNNAPQVQTYANGAWQASGSQVLIQLHAG